MEEEVRRGFVKVSAGLSERFLQSFGALGRDFRTRTDF
jgi:hypothetical protein